MIRHGTRAPKHPDARRRKRSNPAVGNGLSHARPAFFYNPGMSIQRIGSAWIADTARVVGEVTLGQDVSIWYGVAIRGDVAPIVIGDGTNVQDNSVVHCDKGFPNIIGRRVVIGHRCVIHGVEVGDGSMIGMGAVLLGSSKIGKGCIVAAGALVPQGMEVPDGMVAMGMPAKIVRPINDAERAMLEDLPLRYIEVARMHCQDPGNVLTRPYGSSG